MHVQILFSSMFIMFGKEAIQVMISKTIFYLQLIELLNIKIFSTQVKKCQALTCRATIDMTLKALEIEQVITNMHFSLQAVMRSPQELVKLNLQS